MRKYILLFILLISLALNSLGQSVDLSKSFLKTEGTLVNVSSVPDTVLISTFNFNHTPKLVCSSPFEISADGILYKDTILLSASQLNVPIYVRATATQAEETFRSELLFLDGNFILNKRLYLLGSSLDPGRYMSMCTWNLKWFGSPTYCNCDTALASQNVITVLKELEADVFAFQEIVSIPQLEKVALALGNQYDILIADYASQIPNTGTTGYGSAQKLAYIYNKQKLNKVSSFGLLRSTYPASQSTNSPYYYFASGRWPFGLRVRHNVSNEIFNLFNIHGKAFAGNTEHNRRAGAALHMVDSINAHWPNENNIILGDYNDLLEGAISSGFTISPYNYALNNGFVGITLPSKFPGETTYLGSTASVIDNYSFSDKAFLSYAPNSTVILRELDRAFDNFKNTTSDHLPVLSHIKLNTSTNLIARGKANKNILVQPNGNELFIQLAQGFNKKVEISVLTLLGQEVFTSTVENKNVFQERISYLKAGVYIVRMSTKNYTEIHKWLVP